MTDKPDGKRWGFSPKLPDWREAIILLAIAMMVLAYFVWPYLPSAVE